MGITFKIRSALTDFRIPGTVIIRLPVPKPLRAGTDPIADILVTKSFKIPVTTTDYRIPKTTLLTKGITGKAPRIYILSVSPRFGAFFFLGYRDAFDARIPSGTHPLGHGFAIVVEYLFPRSFRAVLRKSGVIKQIKAKKQERN